MQAVAAQIVEYLLPLLGIGSGLIEHHGRGLSHGLALAIAHGLELARQPFELATT